MELRDLAISPQLEALLRKAKGRNENFVVGLLYRLSFTTVTPFVAGHTNLATDDLSGLTGPFSL